MIKKQKGECTDDLRVTMRPAESVSDSFAQATTLGDLSAVLERELDAIGFPLYAYRGMNFGGQHVSPYFCSNYPASWLHHYEERQYVTVDPVFVAGQSSIVPFRWGKRQIIRPKTSAQREFFAEAAEAGLRHGVTVPIHGSGGEFATLSVTSLCAEDEFNKLCAEYGQILHLFAIHYHDGLRKMFSKVSPQQEVHLTPRERECLLWTAKGKTAWEISVILGISDGTVVFHIKNAIRKLGVNNKQHAVVVSIMKNLINP